MKINPKTSYPYPIWCQNDDYKENIKSSDCIIKEAHDKENYIFELQFNITNDDIASLIEREQAVYVCTAYCRSTFTQFRAESKSHAFSISIPRKEVVGEVEMQWNILAKQDIPDFYSETLNDDYQGHASFPLGAVIAEIGVYKFNTIISDEQRSLDDIFAVVLNPDTDEIIYKIDGSKVLIMLPREQLNAFNRVDGKYSSAMHVSIVFQALLIALSHIHEYRDDEEKVWVSVLAYGIECVDDVDTLDEVDDTGYSIQDCLKIANHILQNPAKRMLNDLFEIEKTNDSDA